MKYRAEIDGLRALAVIPVILYHAGFKLFGGGYVGVDVFFVISGYLITTIILAELEAGTFSLLHFYERRARRILPALFVVMFACIPFAWFWLLPDAMKQFSESLVAVSTYASNILFWRTSGYFDTATELKPLIHTWSLAVEEQYYVLFPLFLMLTWKLGKRWIVGLLTVVFVISLAGAQWLSATHPSFAFYMLPTRGWELLIGAFIAFYYSRQNIKKHNHIIGQLGSLFGLSLIAYSVFAYNDKTPFPSIYALVPTLGAAFIIIFATHKTLVGKLLGSKLFVAIGLVSYSTYLWHQPFFAFARERSADEPSLYLMSALVVLSFAFAYLSWKYVERPFRNKHRISRNKIFAYGALCSVLFIGIGLLGYVNKGFPLRKIAMDFKVFDYDTSNLGYIKCNQPSLVAGAQLNYCHQSSKGVINAVLIGDSHADDKFYGIEKNDTFHNWMLIGNSSCPPVLDIDVEGDQKECRLKFEKIIDFIVGDKEIQTVALSFYGNYALTSSYAADHIRKKVGPETIKIKSNSLSNAERDEIFYYGLSNTVRKLINSNKKVYILVDVPELPFFPVNCVKGSANCSIPKIEVMQRQNLHRLELQRLQSQFPSVAVFDPIDIFCSSETCTYRNDDVVLYRDSHHLSFSGSDYYGKVFADWLKVF